MNDDPQFLIARTETKNGVFRVERKKGMKLLEALWGPYPTIVIPLDRVAREVTQAASLILEGERDAEPA